MGSIKVARTTLEITAAALLADVEAAHGLAHTRVVFEHAITLNSKQARRSAGGATSRKVRERELAHLRHLRSNIIEFVELAIADIYADAFTDEQRHTYASSMVKHVWPKAASVPNEGKLERLIEAWALATRLSTHRSLLPEAPEPSAEPPADNAAS